MVAPAPVVERAAALEAARVVARDVAGGDPLEMHPAAAAAYLQAAFSGTAVTVTEEYGAEGFPLMAARRTLTVGNTYYTQYYNDPRLAEFLLTAEYLTIITSKPSTEAAVGRASAGVALLSGLVGGGAVHP